jgi:hypothetical protein
MLLSHCRHRGVVRKGVTQPLGWWCGETLSASIFGAVRGRGRVSAAFVAICETGVMRARDGPIMQRRRRQRGRTFA